MCWPHVHKNVVPQIKTLKKSSGSDKLGKEVLDDIETFQWVVTQKSFEVDYNALEDKYLKGNYNPKEKQALIDFFSYFRDQWGPQSKVRFWFEHANPWHVGHNMGLEGINKDVKLNHTFKNILYVSDF